MNRTPNPMSQIVGATHPGNRDHNEDCFIADSALGLGLVADGMGGYACGELASELVKETIAEAVANSEGLRDAIARAHAVVKETAASDSAKKGMGSTAIVFKLQGQDFELAWVGDSRAYIWDTDSGVLHQITRDHSYVQTLLSSGAISHDEAVCHPNRNLITQAVGVAGDDGLEIELIRGRLGAHQQLLICSDGLVDEVLDIDIAKLMTAAGSLDEAVQSLIEQALINGGSDNITVVIAACEDGIAPAQEPEFVRSTLADTLPPKQPVEARVTAEMDIAKPLDTPADEPRLSPRFLQSLEAMGLDPWVLGAGAGLLVILCLIFLLVL